MPQTKKTTKTEFARYLNEYGADVAQLEEYLLNYNATPARKRTFGFWLKSKHTQVFNDTYTNWWLKNESLWGAIYENQEDIYEPYQ